MTEPPKPVYAYKPFNYHSWRGAAAVLLTILAPYVFVYILWSFFITDMGFVTGLLLSTTTLLGLILLGALLDYLRHRKNPDPSAKAGFFRQLYRHDAVIAAAALSLLGIGVFGVFTLGQWLLPQADLPLLILLTSGSILLPIIVAMIVAARPGTKL